MQVQFAVGRAGESGPLVVTGTHWGPDFAFVRYVEPEVVVFGLNHGSEQVVTGEPTRIVPGRTYELEVHMGSLYPRREALFSLLFPGADYERPRRLFLVRLEGQEVARAERELFLSSPREVTVGYQWLGGAWGGAMFPGRILATARGAPP